MKNKKSGILEDLSRLIADEELCIVPLSRVAKEEFGYATAMKVILENGLYLEFQKQLNKMKKKAEK